MTAKDSLAHTLNVVTTLRSQLETLRSDHAYFKLLTSETHGMMREENSSIRLEILLFCYVLYSAFSCMAWVIYYLFDMCPTC